MFCRGIAKFIDQANQSLVIRIDLRIAYAKLLIPFEEVHLTSDQEKGVFKTQWEVIAILHAKSWLEIWTGFCCYFDANKQQKYVED